ncbi:RICIN domain-containing protein [Streptomyces sp. PU-14G]|uniref:RICIN domain-containing protein n=1 Tax=Streptomyces sp. PU-14G TaxID=2800808 RepID=UPI0034E03EEF
MLLNRTVYLDHYQTGLSLGPDGWDTAHDRQVDGYHLADDPAHEAGYRWYISATPEGGGGLRIRNTPGASPRQGRCMEAVPTDHSGLKRKALIWLKPCDSDNPNQRWYVNTNGVPDGTFTLSPQGHPDLAVGPDYNAGVYPGDDWHTRLDTRGPYLGQVWRTRAAPTAG